VKHARAASGPGASVPHGVPTTPQPAGTVRGWRGSGTRAAHRLEARHPYPPLPDPSTVHFRSRPPIRRHPTASRRWHVVVHRVHLSLLLLLSVACTGPRPSPDAISARVDSLTLEQRAAQLVVLSAPVRTDQPGLPPGLRAWIAANGVGGLLLRAGDAGWAAQLRDSAEAVSRVHPLLVVAELDAAHTNVAELTVFPPLAAAVHLAEEREMRALGAEVGMAARRLGAGMGIVRLATLDTAAAVLLARDGESLRRGAVAYLQGIAGTGLRPAAEVFGGAGPTPAWDRARLDAIERPYARAVRQTAAALVVGDATVPALTGDSLEIAVSPAGTGGVVRRDLAWQGLVLADLAPDGRAAQRFGSGEAAVRALLSGADLLVGVTAPDSVVAAVSAAVRAGRIPESLIVQRVRRVLEFRATLPAPPAQPAPAAPAPSELAVRLARESWAWAGAPLPPAALGEGAWVVTALGRGDRFARSLAALAAGTRHLRLNLSADSAMLVQTIRDEAGAARLLVVAEADDDQSSRLRRIVRAAFAADSAPPAAYAVRFLGRPPTAADLASRGLVVWGTGGLAQETAARVLAGDHGRERAPYWAAPPARTLRPVPAESAGFDAARLAAVDAVIERAIAAGVFPGAALAVGRRGGLVRLRGYGRTAAEPGAPAVSATQSLYDVASLTKVAATTAAVMRLVGEGRLDVGAPVQRYVPEFRGAGKEAVTVWHLLTHTSGLPAGAWLFGSAASPEQALRQVLNARLTQPPGRRVVYSDFGFILLAEVAARAAGTPLDELLAARVYAPLGMASTSFLPPLAQRAATVPTAPPAERRYRVQGEVHDGNAFRLGGVAGHAGLFSTAADLAVFAQTMLNGGAYGAVRVFEPEVVQRFVARQRNTDTRALGWDTPGPQSAAGRFVSARTYGHLGFTGTSLWIDPERGLFVVLLTNRTLPGATSPQMQQVRREVHDAVLQAIGDVTIRPRPGTPPPPRPARPPPARRRPR
jgi:CubicO group peptidase (beta-lactamase class C family)